MTDDAAFTPGALVEARGREWVVLPESDEKMLVLRPLGGTDAEIAGIHLALEEVRPAEFDLTDPEQAGDARSARLLRDALRLGFRSSAGPFRSFGRLNFEPRPYQLVPLLMALQLDPVRMLIADDVGIGKTVESLLIARELLDQGDVERIAVLCPPHLAPQWQAELRDKFGIEAELVLPSTTPRLERRLAAHQSLFEVNPFVVVSSDFIKADRHRDEFVRNCPELVVVDEAHTFAFDHAGRGRHQRHELLHQLAADGDRHLILVTATPHSGKEDSFRSLLAFLDPEFAELPDDLGGAANESARRRLARHLVQRRRSDITSYLAEVTTFPQREQRQVAYRLSDAQKELLKDLLAYARERIHDESDGRHRQRIRWWSALALLRSFSSSPAAAVATLESRGAPAGADSVAEVDEIGRRTVLDVADEEEAETMDVAPGAAVDGGGGEADAGADRRATAEGRRLREFARRAEALQGKEDPKLAAATDLISELIADDYDPIVFCRFIPTAEYVAEHLRTALGRDAEVVAVTGRLAPAERERRIEELGQAPRRVLVATDCLSEGINLQEHFTAVVHYDLSWNPTRHEQREGRVDRFGQRAGTVRIATLYGADNPVDGVVMQVLLEKHREIRSRLGVAVPIPVDSDTVMNAVFEGLLAEDRADVVEQLSLLDDVVAEERERFHGEWDAAVERERRSRTIFAQHTIKPDEVARDLRAARAAIGSHTDVERFVRDALSAHGLAVGGAAGKIDVDLREAPTALRDLLGGRTRLRGVFDEPAGGAELLGRTSSVVSALASHTLDTALDPIEHAIAARCGAIRTSAVERRTTLLLLRLRYDLTMRRGRRERHQLAEEARIAAFENSPAEPAWLSVERAEELLEAEAEANIGSDQRKRAVEGILDHFDALAPDLDELARSGAQELVDAYVRTREALGSRGRGSFSAEPRLPVDVLGVYVFLPVIGD